jgi:formylglycine-generating enzyme required for sulfatase activity
LVVFRHVVSVASAVAFVACNVLSGSSDLTVCEGALCGEGEGGVGNDRDGSSSSSGGADGDAPPMKDAGISAQPCTPTDAKRCDGRAAAACVDSKWSTTLCPETCLEGVCAPWPSCRTSVDDGATCGLDRKSCCESKLVPGGTFKRRNSDSLAATIGPFELDTFEVTVARFRAFVNAGMGTRAKPPPPQAGAHPRIPMSGWRPEWNERLPAETPGLKSMLGGGTWTGEPGANEQKPITNVSWMVAFAFCAWDGGRLPTYAEWNFAAAGGTEQRTYPWSMPAGSTTIEPKHAAYSCNFELPPNTCPPPACSVGGGSPCNATTCSAAGGVCQPQPCFGCDLAKDVAPVGSLRDGAARWGHLDMAGNASEFVLDALPKNTRPELETNCVDCARVMGPDPTNALQGGNDDYVVFILGGAWNEGSGSVQTTSFLLERWDERSTGRGFRCARD